MAKKLTEEKVLRAFESSPSNPYQSVNDYWAESLHGVFWVMGEDGRKWHAWVKEDQIVFTEYTRS